VLYFLVHTNRPRPSSALIGLLNSLVKYPPPSTPKFTSHSVLTTHNARHPRRTITYETCRPALPSLTQHPFHHLCHAAYKYHPLCFPPSLSCSSLITPPMCSNISVMQLLNTTPYIFHHLRHAAFKYHPLRFPPSLSCSFSIPPPVCSTISVMQLSDNTPYVFHHLCHAAFKYHSLIFPPSLSCSF